MGYPDGRLGHANEALRGINVHDIGHNFISRYLLGQIDKAGRVKSIELATSLADVKVWLARVFSPSTDSSLYQAPRLFKP
jgi:hypothetical protein